MEDYIDFNNFLFCILCNSFIFQFKSTSGLWFGFFYFCNLNTFVDSAAHSKGLFRSLRLQKLRVPAGLCSQHLRGRAGSLAGEEMLLGAGLLVALHVTKSRGC